MMMSLRKWWAARRLRAKCPHIIGRSFDETQALQYGRYVLGGPWYTATIKSIQKKIDADADRDIVNERDGFRTHYSEEQLRSVLMMRFAFCPRCGEALNQPYDDERHS